MSNLGPYQQIVEDAKRAGGVDALIDLIEQNAKNSARPKQIGVGALLALSSVGLIAGGRKVVHQIGGTRRAAERAKELLRSNFGGLNQSSWVQDDELEPEGDPDVEGGNARGE